MSSGFTDKLYWRRRHGWTAFHCFKKCSDGGFVSLCDNYTLTRSGGQGIRRPPAIQRCPICDGAEMERRGWEESGPGSEDWL